MWNNSILLASHSSDSYNTNLLGCGLIAANFYPSLYVMQTLWKQRTMYAAKVDQTTRLTNAYKVTGVVTNAALRLFLQGILSATVQRGHKTAENEC